MTYKRLMEVAREAHRAYRAGYSGSQEWDDLSFGKQERWGYAVRAVMEATKNEPAEEKQDPMPQFLHELLRRSS